MANSRLGMETKAITEGAVMATLTAILAMAGIYIPLLEPFIMMIWTLPVVVVCMRWGMRTGAATMAVAGIIILIASSPLYAAEMILRSTGPALLIGYGFRWKWKTEKTILYTALAAFLGLGLSYAISFLLMGVRFDAFFAVQPETIDEMVALFNDYGLTEAFRLTADEMVDFMTSAFLMIRYLFPSILLISGLFTAITNYAAANFVLRKLKIPLPPVSKLASFRLPFELVFCFIAGFGMTVIGGVFYPETPVVAEIGQNIMTVFIALYMFQGIGLLLYYVEKTPPHMRVFWKIMLIMAIILTAFQFLYIICLTGIIDALLDFRRLELLFKKGKERGRGL